MRFPLRKRAQSRGIKLSTLRQVTRPSPRTLLPAPPPKIRVSSSVLAHEAVAAEAFTTSVQGLLTVLDRPDVKEAIANGDLADLLDIFDTLDWADFEGTLSRGMSERVVEVIAREGKRSYNEIAMLNQNPLASGHGTSPPQLPPTTYGDPLPSPGPRSGFYATTRFDMTNPFAIRQAEQFAADLVREVTKSTRNAIKQAVVDAFNNGTTADVLARQLRSTIGLTSRQARAVENYRDRLLRGDMDLDLDRVEVLTRRYWRKTLNRRAQTIARTEVMRASNYGRMQGWLSASDAGMLDLNQSTKEWITAPHASKYGPPCTVCLPMDGTKVMGVETPFKLPDGRDVQMPPGHPNAVLFGSTFVPYGELDEMVRASYRGPAVRISAGSKVTTIGPNHPMLTRRGMVKARDLHEGDELVYDRRVDAALARRGEPDLEQVVLVEDAFEACLASGAHATVATSGHDLHGDRVYCKGEVEVVVPEHGLLFVLDPCGIEQRREGFLVEPDVDAALLARDGAGDLALDGVNGPPASGVSGDSAWGAHFQFLTVHSVNVGEFVGMAYDATTTSSLYCSDGFVVSNCRCTAVVWPPEPPEDWDPEYPYAQV